MTKDEFQEQLDDAGHAGVLASREATKGLKGLPLAATRIHFALGATGQVEKALDGLLADERETIGGNDRILESYRAALTALYTLEASCRMAAIDRAGKPRS